MDMMKPLLLSTLLLLIFFSGCLSASSERVETPDPVEISGVLAGDKVLSGEVILGGDLLVPRGVTLRIEPGTTLYVRPSESTKIDPEYLSSYTEVLVRGTLKCLGSVKKPVRFVPLTEGDEIAWAGIILDGAVDSVVKGTEIASAETGILCVGTSPIIEENLIKGCRYALIAQEKSSPEILSNRMEGGEGGVFCFRGSNPHLNGNTIADNEEEGVFIDRTSRPLLEFNAIRGNAIGVAYYSPDLAIDTSGVSANEEDLRLLYLSPGGGE